MTSAKRVEDFPREYLQVMQIVREKGSHTVVFDSEAECYGERLKFYKFIAALKREGSHEFSMLAHGVVVQWKKDTAPEKYVQKRVLVISANAGASKKWVAENESAREVEEREEKDAVLRAEIARIKAGGA